MGFGVAEAERTQYIYTHNIITLYRDNVATNDICGRTDGRTE
jgi:hypothetical protein